MGRKLTSETIEKIRMSHTGRIMPLEKLTWAIDITGLKFNLLTALKFSHHSQNRQENYWEFICDCGTKKTLRKHDATRGRIKSCGCLLKLARFPIRIKKVKTAEDTEKKRLCANRQGREWRMRHKEQWSIINRNQRHKRRALGNINFNEWIAKVMMLGNKCQKCSKTEPEIKITIDHIVPVSKGGTNHIGNLQPLCFICNVKKGNKLT